MSDSRETPVTFSREEIRRIRELMSTPRAQVVCPLCEATLMLVGPIEADGKVGTTFEVNCRPCHRSAIITDVPGTDWMEG